MNTIQHHIEQGQSNTEAAKRALLQQRIAQYRAQKLYDRYRQGFLRFLNANPSSEMQARFGKLFNQKYNSLQTYEERKALKQALLSARVEFNASKGSTPSSDIAPLATSTVAPVDIENASVPSQAMDKVSRIDNSHLAKPMLTSHNPNSRVANRWIMRDGSQSPYTEAFLINQSEYLHQIFTPTATLESVTEGIASAIQRGNLEMADTMSADLFKANIYAVVDSLDVSGNATYLPANGLTYCNIYAHDVVTAMGGYLPRIWNMNDNPDTHLAPVYGQNVREMNVNSLVPWMEEHGSRYGWEKVTDMNQAQTAANNGNLTIIMGAKYGSNGHVSVVLPETQSLKASNRNGQFIPLQSQAGATNFNASSNVHNWWNDGSHQGGAAWVYKGGRFSQLPLRHDELGGDLYQ